MKINYTHPDADSSSGWFFTSRGTQHGPYPLEQIQQLVREGKIGLGDYFWDPLLGRWNSFEQTPSLSSLLRTGSETDQKPPNLFAAFLNPGLLIKNNLQGQPWPLAFLVSGFAFIFFFLQVGLDLHRSGAISAGQALALASVGLVYGTLGVSLLAYITWLLASVFKSNCSLTWALQAFALSFAPTMIYVSFGLVANLFFDWNSSIAFGVTGVVWALIPISNVTNTLVEGRKTISIALTTLSGLILLFSWFWLSLL